MDYYPLLISFCNNNIVSSSQTVFAKIPSNFDSSRIELYPVFSGVQDVISSITGLCQDENSIYLLQPGYPSRLVALSKESFHVLFEQDLPEISDAHSMMSRDGRLYIISTGTDEVISYEINENSLIKPEVVWQASSIRKDTHHINSIIKVNEEIFISAFGPKKGALNSSAKNGYIYNITSDTFLTEGIYHPHTLSESNGLIFYCESSKRRFCSVNNEVVTLNGYTRGTAWLNDDIVCLATSIGREVSKSTGEILNPSNPGKPDGKCELICLNVLTKQILCKADLSIFGPEIYDLILIEDKAKTAINNSSAYFKEREKLNIFREELINVYQAHNEQNKTINSLKTQIKQQKKELTNFLRSA